MRVILLRKAPPGASRSTNDIFDSRPVRDHPAGLFRVKDEENRALVSALELRALYKVAK